jgi:Trehalose utilisation
MMRMNRRIRTLFFLTLSSFPCLLFAQSTSPDHTRRIVLVAGETAKVDKVGHHDYIAGCKCLSHLLRQVGGVTCENVENGWPQDESVFKNARSIVFYTDGGGKQAFLESPERVAKIQSLVDAGVGIVMIHQAVDFPDEFEKLAKEWLGGVYLKNQSGRGHWDSAHVDFPAHAITAGVEPWKINDGWLNGIAFVEGMRGVTPLVWSGKEYQGSRAGLDRDIVAWSYDRRDHGRSFVFTGLDAHSAWSHVGLRKLMVNGIVWSAGIEIPSGGIACDIESSQLDSMLTPREEKKPAAKKRK